MTLILPQHPVWREYPALPTTGTKLSYELNIFVWLEDFSVLHPEMIVISTTILHRAVKCISKWEFIHETDRNFCLTSTDI